MHYASAGQASPLKMSTDSSLPQTSTTESGGSSLPLYRRVVELESRRYCKLAGVESESTGRDLHAFESSIYWVREVC